MRLGILGLPQGGKTTLFEILVSNAPPRAAGARQDRVGVVRVPDARVDELGQMAEEAAGSNPNRLSKNGSIDPDSVPHSTTPTNDTPTVIAISNQCGP